MAACSVCGGPYLLIDGLCGECLLVANGSWGDAPVPVHEPVYGPDGSLRYLPGFVEDRDHLAHVSSALSSARESRQEARLRPVSPLVVDQW